MRAVAVAAALTSTSLRERWREPGEEAAAGVRVWAALAGGRPAERRSEPDTTALKLDDCDYIQQCTQSFDYIITYLTFNIYF